MTPETAAMTEAVIQSAIKRGVTDVCQTMIQKEATFLDKVPAEQMDGRTFQMLGTIGFLGDVNGIIHLCMSPEFARDVTSGILGIPSAEIDETGTDIKDAVGEVTNMTAGVFRNALCNLGFPCKLSVPMFIRGSHLKVARIKETDRYSFHFQCGDHPLIVDIQLRAS